MEERTGDKTEGDGIICLNDEFLGAEEADSLSSEEHAATKEINISVELDQRLEPVRPERLRPGNLVPGAAAAIHLGLKVTRHKLGITS